MKCVCGYAHAKDDKEQKYLTEMHKEYYKNTHFGKRDFIEVNGHFTVEEGDWHKHQQEVRLYACPECNTVQLLR